MSARRSIEDWFAKHDDGEFIHHRRSAPYLVIGPVAGSSRVLYTTKPAAVLAAIGESEIPRDLAIIGGYGLPAIADIQWIAKFAKRNLVFLGDLDPPDLMIFAWLREHLRRKQPKFLGISDGFLRALGVRFSKSPTIQLAPSEAECVPVLEGILRDLVSLVGSSCARRLRDGNKLEIEGVLGAEKTLRVSILDLISDPIT